MQDNVDLWMHMWVECSKSFVKLQYREEQDTWSQDIQNISMVSWQVKEQDFPILFICAEEGTYRKHDLNEYSK